MKVSVRFYDGSKNQIAQCSTINTLSVFECANCRGAIFIRIEQKCRGCGAEVIVERSTAA